MTFKHYWRFLPACFAINMALGPNNVLTISNGARSGVRSAILAALGCLLVDPPPETRA
jgi:threonine/homoserine/homoserine lactone efflux protein